MFATPRPHLQYRVELVQSALDVCEKAGAGTLNTTSHIASPAGIPHLHYREETEPRAYAFQLAQLLREAR